jgi:hypothetical protein
VCRRGGGTDVPDQLFDSCGDLVDLRHGRRQVLDPRREPKPRDAGPPPVRTDDQAELLVDHPVRALRGSMKTSVSSASAASFEVIMGEAPWGYRRRGAVLR